MSLTADYKTEIRVPEPELRAARANIRGLPSMRIMQQAVEIVAREQGGSVTEGYEDCVGKTTPCVIGLKTPEFPRGVSMTIASDGKVLFRYDAEGGVAHAAKLLCDEVCRVYATIAVLHAQRKLGYRVSTRDEVNAAGRRQVVISAIRD